MTKNELIINELRKIGYPDPVIERIMELQPKEIVDAIENAPDKLIIDATHHAFGGINFRLTMDMYNKRYGKLAEN